MTLRELLAALPGATASGPLDAEVGALAIDSRRVRPGDVFFALPGVKDDGARFATAAVAAGAVAVVGPRGLRVPGAAAIEVDEPRLGLAQAARARTGDPSRDLIVTGVTGTNGKTTTTYLLRALGLGRGVVGTTGVLIGDEVRATAFTTPEAPELQALLREMRDTGAATVAMEVSSHALVQRRAWGIGFDAVVFTNLTQDHLDYHGTLEAYFDAKLMLFDGRNGRASKRGAVAVVNADDPHAPRVLAAAALGGYRPVTYGAAPSADVRLESVEAVPGGLRIALRDPHGLTVRRLGMLGRYNAWNAAAACATAIGLGRPSAGEAVFERVAVPGRLEPVDAGQPFTVVVDYAHTPDALERALAACREHAEGRVLCVFGCGGDRDRGKRPQMGAIAARAADAAWVTNDNPRSEDPAEIARQIVEGAPGGGLVTLLDRRAALAAALAAARPGDVVLVAGKGHETTQTIGASVLPFDDRLVARELLEGRP